MLHLYIHGRGRGHATRGLAILETLERQGHKVRVFAGGDALPIIAASADAESIDSVRAGPDAPGLIRRRTYEAACAVRADRAAAVVSDGDFPGLSGAAEAGVPAIAVGHGLAFACGRRPAYAPGGVWYRAAVHALGCTRGATQWIGVNFAPLRPRPGRVVARPAVAGARRRPGGPVVCYFRDGAPDLVRQLVSLGVEPEVFAERDPGIAGVTHRPIDHSVFVHAVLRAHCVVATAGSQLISECSAWGVPLFAVHAAADDEQRLNVVMARAAGCADGASLDAISIGRLRNFIAAPPNPAALDWAAPSVDDAVADAVARI